ncbi:carboxymuconolactone decarboxylase family protein [Burkholderia multivorans]|uniref:Carboxymuconolactone decarboxylase family protein n=2 Tax=Burkholderia multivorans TaxID=87883 RepID=A0AAP2HHD8_9BURK|nr:carboxymuconolactone decarboxylase family protein [Burkholderia multivorans]MBU9356124.1 carboxymuconolactone decarboxylase family protein [Burkholderia multivorans]MBU9597094.1 carboxymuconolactone decarboxylase family protein [Burkholderia multivorans]MBU9651199.1 carboxymuconolactone decarboxylase family protein [Burkholderia multivorans]MCA8488068.1 carboxymuconolactone decarboxylase family protein [Burkholderia multivorans]
MKTNPRTPSSQRLTDANPEAMQHYNRMRVAISTSTTFDGRLSEVVLTAQFAVLGHEFPFKIHARRAMEQGMTVDALRALLMAGLGVTLVASEVGRALAWLDEATIEA